ncbi:RnfH family protein [Halomonas sp. TRM85114]|uniref:RnfH family protein n=1 Tax=Halomonas jincaotanensis TaxID=2810616 RepID=UPI001BD27A8C|nr:RnfH family protein [Halomonas jincaotanensis]MBS9405167.1 RnfH family protein [Halomonas jincaotanensis]
MAAEPINIEVAYALPSEQRIIQLSVPGGTTAREALMLARLEAHFPECNAATFRDADLGIFGALLKAPDQYVLKAGDRVEVYRPLQIDPKAARVARASRTKR